MSIRVKRVYEAADKKDGVRILVDRLWPRGLTKAAAKVDEWLRDLAPSNELRKWYHAHPERWQQFRQDYMKELAEPEPAADLSKLYSLAHGRKQLTLLFASKNLERNNAIVLKELLEGMRKPPTGTGPGVASATRARAAATKRR
jgi:uncharacterized protein YeaO (DUF488 family)